MCGDWRALGEFELRVIELVASFSTQSEEVAPSEAPRRKTPRTAHQVGGYRLVRLIAEGGMGQVYEVKHVELGRRAALKVMLPEIAKNEEMAARFFTEARAMSLVHHPALIHVYEYGHLDDGGAYIVMEYVEGQSLREMLSKRGGKLSMVVAITLVRQIAAALHAIHEKGVIHRDLKPDNIMFIEGDEESLESRIKILDFGIAKLTVSDSDKQQTPDPPRTDAGNTDLYGPGAS